MILLKCQNLLGDYILWLFSLILVDICATGQLTLLSRPVESGTAL